MVWNWNFMVMVILLTSFSFAMIFMFGTGPLAMALVWLISRFPGHTPATCLVFQLEPPGPWPGVCERACPDRPGPMGVRMIDVCRLMSGENMAYSQDELEEKLKTVRPGSIIFWDDVPFWMGKYHAPRPSDFSEFWTGVNESLN